MSWWWLSSEFSKKLSKNKPTNLINMQVQMLQYYYLRWWSCLCAASIDINSCLRCSLSASLAFCNSSIWRLCSSFSASLSATWLWSCWGALHMPLPTKEHKLKLVSEELLNWFTTWREMLYNRCHQVVLPNVRSFLSNSISAISRSDGAPMRREHRVQDFVSSDDVILFSLTSKHIHTYLDDIVGWKLSNFIWVQ